MAAYSTITDVDEELEVETSAKKVSVVTAVAVYKCRRCLREFSLLEHDVACKKMCPVASHHARDGIDRMCCLIPYRACWYHLTKDEFPDADIDDMNITRCNFAESMTVSLWTTFAFLTCICSPCLLLWCPFSLCEYISRFFGANDRPHSLRLNKMQTNAEALVAKMSKTTQKISALAGSESVMSVITDQPGMVPMIGSDQVFVPKDLNLEIRLEEGAVEDYVNLSINADKDILLV